MKKLEIEQKYRVGNPIVVRQRIRGLGAKKIFSDVEFNELLDTNGKLLRSGRALRLRHYGGQKGILTFKGRRLRGKSKKRLEIETQVDYKAAREILKQTGYRIAVKYKKWREDYRFGKALISLDHLSRKGWFLEIEGAPAQISSIARRLGFKEADREDRTYAELVKAGSRIR